MFAMLQQVRWAHHPIGASVQHMRIEDRGLYVTAEQSFLDGSNVMATLQAMGNECKSSALGSALAAL